MLHESEQASRIAVQEAVVTDALEALGQDVQGDVPEEVGNR